MEYFEVEGGHRLHGEIVPQGAKNEALQILCAVLLTSEPVTISNLPDIVDVNKLIDILGSMGVKVEKQAKDTYRFQSDDLDMDYLVSPEFSHKARALRGSIMLVGPLLARFGMASISRPGGDKIGRRRLDTHFWGFQQLGARFDYDKKEGIFHVSSQKIGFPLKKPLLDSKNIPFWQ